MNGMCEDAKMNKKTLKKHYNKILNFPDLTMHPERTDDLKAKIKQLAYIDHISYQLALVKIYSVFLIRSSRTHRTNPDDDNVKKIETATINLLDLCSIEGLDDRAMAGLDDNKPWQA